MSYLSVCSSINILILLPSFWYTTEFKPHGELNELFNTYFAIIKIKYYF